MTFGKRQLVLAALVVALGAAVYLNWQFAGDSTLPTTNTVTSSGGNLGDAQYVGNPQNSALGSEEPANSEDTGSDKPTMSANASEYFAQTRLSRQQARDEAVELLTEVLESADSSESAKTEAVQKAAAVADNVQKESNIENLIKAKGFAECVAFINDGECTVTVSTDGLEANQALAIKEIVNTQAKIDYEKIKIVEIK